MIMSRKHFKLCLRCINFQKVKDNSKGCIYRYGFVNGFWNGELMCRYKLIPQNNRGNETCTRYKSENSRRNKK